MRGCPSSSPGASALACLQVRLTVDKSKTTSPQCAGEAIPPHTTCAHPHVATPGPSAQAVGKGAKASDSSIEIAAQLELLV